MWLKIESYYWSPVSSMIVLLNQYTSSLSCRFISYPAIMGQWLKRSARNQKVPGSRPATAMSLLGDWFTQP
jgi:hypothetical protein